MSELTADMLRDTLDKLTANKRPEQVQYIISERDFDTLLRGVERLETTNADLLTALNGYIAQHNSRSRFGRCGCGDCKLARAAIEKAKEGA